MKTVFLYGVVNIKLNNYRHYRESRNPFVFDSQPFKMGFRFRENDGFK